MTTALVVLLACAGVVVLFVLVMVVLAVRSHDDEPATLEGGRSHMRGKR